MKQYLDYNATTPVFDETVAIMSRYLSVDFGNAGSRTHETGAIAKKAISNARSEIANYMNASSSELIFTSGATESNNIALFGLLEYAKQNNLNHIVTSSIEHKAILDPLKKIEELGFKVSYVNPDKNGRISTEAICESISDKTFLVSCMHANNETGVINPIDELANKIKDLNNEIYFHSDCSQSFAKTNLSFKNTNIDMISFSGHKFHGPKGIGGLLIRKRDGESAPVTPIMYGGGQERGIRPGTLPVHLIAGLHKSFELCYSNNNEWMAKCQEIKGIALDAFKDLNYKIYGSVDKKTLPNTLSIAFEEIDAEALILILKDVAEISTGSACTSSSYTPSHVLMSMGLTESEATKVVRISWSSDTNISVFDSISRKIKQLT